MKILIGCNLLTSVNSMAYPAHMQFWYNLGKKMPEHEFMFFSPRRMGIDRMRNEAAKFALQQGCDYLFFYDDDVVLPDDTLDVLLNETPGMVRAGVTLIRSAPYDPMIFKYVEEGGLTFYKDYEKYKDSKGVVECGAVGFSCCLIDCAILTAIQPPYFITGPANTEDVYFCHKINTEFGTGYINVNTRIATGHLLDQYYISPANKHHFIRLEKGLNNMFSSFQVRDREDRDELYREQVMERIRNAQAAM